MLANRSSVALKWGFPLVGLALLTMGCGGKDEVRPVGDSTKPSESALSDCEAQGALEQQSLLPLGDFEVESVGSWGSTTDKSSNIRCPQDSSFDCCPSGLTQEQQKKLGLNCPPTDDVPMTSLFFGSTGSQQIPADWPAACPGAAPKGRALHVRAAQFTAWGAQVYYTFSPAKDASMFDGISCWVRLGQGGTAKVGQSLFVVLEDKFTKENQDKYEIAVDENGAYVLEPNANEDPTPVFATDPATGERILQYPAYSTNVPAKTCYDVNVDAMKCDRFGAGIGLEPEWRFIKIPFDSMRQRGYGVKSPAGRVLKEELLGFGVYMDVGTWDFWIDQVAFYKDAPQSGQPENEQP